MSPIIIPGSGYSLTEYRASIAAKGYDVTNTTALDVAINEARRRMLRDHRWSFLQEHSTALVATVGNPAVSLTGLPDMLWLDAVRLESAASSWDLDYLPEQEFRSMETGDASTGIPTFYTVAAGAVRLYPAPDLAYALVLDFSSLPSDLAAGADVDEIPRAYADLVVWAAIPNMGFRQREAWAMQYAEQRYLDLLRTAIGQDNIQQRQSSRQVKSGYWGRG